MEQADGEGQVGNPICGDIMKLSIKVEDDRSWTLSSRLCCGAAIASCSMLTEMVKGKTIEEARTITNRDVAEALGGCRR